MIIEDYHYTLFKKRGSDRTHEIFYYAFYDENGKRCKRSTACTTERNARAYVNKLIATGKFEILKNKIYRFVNYISLDISQ